MLLLLAALSLQPAQTSQPPADPAASPDPRRVTVIAPQSNAARRDPPILSRIRRRAIDAAAHDSLAAMLLREWAACTVRNNRAGSVALLGSQLNSPQQSEFIDQLTGRRFTRRTVCARFRSMRVDNLVLRGAVAEALQRWEEARRRSAGPLSRPAGADATGSVESLAQAGYCVMDRDPQGVQRLMATRPGTRSSASAIEALQEPINACLPDSLQATDFHPLLLRGALGEPYLLGRRAPGPGASAIIPAVAAPRRS